MIIIGLIENYFKVFYNGTTTGPFSDYKTPYSIPSTITIDKGNIFMTSS